MSTHPEAHFRAVKGVFSLLNAQPDGDSIHFKPDNDKAFQGLRNEHRARPNKNGEYQLRFEGIDAPELHYGDGAQPRGKEARDALLKLLGFEQVTYKNDAYAAKAGTGVTVTASTPAAIRGVVLTKALEVHGRPISFLLTEEDGKTHDLESMSSYAVGKEILNDTVNAKMVAAGEAYPLLYTSTPRPHRDYFRDLAAAAREKGSGVWKADSTAEFVARVPGQPHARDNICQPNGALLYPKIFRRLIDMLKDASFTGDLGEYLEATPKEDDAVLYQEQIEMQLHQFFAQTNSRTIFQGDLLDLVFVEK